MPWRFFAVVNRCALYFTSNYHSKIKIILPKWCVIWSFLIFAPLFRKIYSCLWSRNYLRMDSFVGRNLPRVFSVFLLLFAGFCLFDSVVTNLHIWPCNFARFARAFFVFVHFEAVLVPSTTWNDFWHLTTKFHFQFQSSNHSFNSRIVGARFASQTTWNNRGMNTEVKLSDDVLAFVDVGFG